MKTVAVLALGLATCLALAAVADEKPAKPDDKKADTPKIEGKYTLVSGKKNGADADEMSKKAKYTIDDKKITIDGGDTKFVMTYKIDPKTTPAQIDMEIVESPIPDAKGSKGYGIIEAKGDTLKLAYSLDKDERPKDFAGKKGFAFEFKKEKAK